MQIIFHIDLNAFFASAEIAKNPSLKGKPVVICNESRRAIITTASYEARKYGIHSAMPLFKAKELCPHIITVKPHFDLYRSLSSEFFEVIASFSPLLEVASIDECYVDMTEYIKNNNDSIENIALKIQNTVYEKLDLQCSIGIAPNKFLAKMASDMKKPMGITVITNKNYKEMIWPLPVGDMFGVGKKTAPKLIEQGIYTIGDLAKYENYSKLKSIFGKNALLFYQKANGKDFSKIHLDHNQLKSVGNSTTFERDSNDEEYIKSIFKKLSHDVSYRAQKRNLVSNTVCITLKYTREKSKTKQTIIDHYMNDYETIYATAIILFESMYHGEMLRLVGVSLNNVTQKEDLNIQISLFDKVEEKQNNEIDKLIKDLNSSFDDKTFVKASSLISKENVQMKYLKNKDK